MKETANVELGFPGEIIQAPGPVRFRHQHVQPEKDRTTMHLLIPLALIALVTAVLMTTSLGRSKPIPAVAPPLVHSTLVGNVAGHEINADIDTSGFIVDRNKEPGVEFLGHKLVIEKERLLLDGMERAKIPAGAKLKIVVSDTKLSVTADGRKTFHTTIKR
jgi:hypothetical protein